MQKPEWLKIRPPKTEHFANLKQSLAKRKLVTVCQEAACPNMSECWDQNTATFMVLGDTCTRACKFCHIKTAFPAQPLDKDEPQKIAEAVKEMKLDYVVITSVDRDDLPDEGSKHFANCITTIKQSNPKIKIEVLIPDFKGKEDLIQNIIHANPDVIAHNIETVERLQHPIRDPRANYQQSINLLKYVKDKAPHIKTKSAIMLGMGETEDEVIQAMEDLKENNVDILTIGQYLRPTDKHWPVKEYVHPDIFKRLEKKGRDLGIITVAGPFVRSSYKARELFLNKTLI